MPYYWVPHNAWAIWVLTPNSRHDLANRYPASHTRRARCHVSIVGAAHPSHILSHSRSVHALPLLLAQTPDPLPPLLLDNSPHRIRSRCQ
eukprot:3749414-Rhodomonas_salina.1